MVSIIQPEQVKLAQAMASAWVEDRKGQAHVSAAAVAVSLVVGLVVAALVSAFLVPIGIDEINNATTTSWSSGAQSMWDILDTIIVLSLFLFFVALALSAANRV